MRRRSASRSSIFPRNAARWTVRDRERGGRSKKGRVPHVLQLDVPVRYEIANAEQKDQWQIEPHRP